MSAASDYTEVNLLNAITGQAAFPAPGLTYVALHTAAPSEDGTATNEVTNTAWPSYARRNVEDGGAIGTGWSAPITVGSTKQTKNTNILTFSTNNGAGTVTVTHWSVWNASTVGAGNMILSKSLTTPVNILPGDIFVFDINSLTLTAD
jgi:hypothetical protein